MSPRPVHPVAGNDGIWLQDRPSNRMVINAILLVEALDLPSLHALLRARLLEVGGGETYRRLRQSVVRRGGRPWWSEPAAELDLGAHVFEVDDPALRTREGLQRHVGTEAARPLPDDRPLWQVQVVQGFEGGRTALYFRIHHCLGDGIALVRLLFQLTDPAADGADRATRLPRQRRGAQGALARWVALPLAGPAIVARHFVSRADRHDLHGSPLAGEKRVAWSRELDLDAVKRIKDGLDATVNDVLMAAVAGAFARYLAAEGATPVGEIRASVPVNVRPPRIPPVLENRFVAVLFRLPAGLGDARERVLEVRRRMQKLKGGVEPLAMFGAANLFLKVLPPRWSRHLIDFFANKCTCVLTNVPGPAEPVYLAGRRLVDAMFWVPQRADIGIGISILSYAGRVRVGVIADIERIARPERFLDAFHEEIGAMERLADGASGRS